VVPVVVDGISERNWHVSLPHKIVLRRLQFNLEFMEVKSESIFVNLQALTSDVTPRWLAI
jgi:hypothetical protein